MEPEPLKCEAVKFYIREVGEETALGLLCQLGLLPPDFFVEAPIKSFTETPIKFFTEVPIKIPIESFAEAPIEVPIESFAEAPIEVPTESFVEAPIEAPIEAVTEAPVVKSYDESPVEATITKAFTKSVARNLATTSCSGMATKSLLQAKYLVKTAPFVRLEQHTCTAVFVFDPGGTNVSNSPTVIPRVF